VGHIAGKNSRNGRDHQGEGNMDFFTRMKYGLPMVPIPAIVVTVYMLVFLEKKLLFRSIIPTSIGWIHDLAFAFPSVQTILFGQKWMNQEENSMINPFIMLVDDEALFVETMVKRLAKRELEVIMLTGQASVESAVEGMKLGPLTS
jgi:hypothetical protein